MGLYGDDDDDTRELYVNIEIGIFSVLSSLIFILLVSLLIKIYKSSKNDVFFNE